MGVQIRHEFIYPLEDAFAVYLSDYFNNSLFVIQVEHPLSDYSVSYISIIVEISRLISIIMEIVPPAADIRSTMWYNYLYSDSNRSVMFTPNAIAIISS